MTFEGRHLDVFRPAVVITILNPRGVTERNPRRGLGSASMLFEIEWTVFFFAVPLRSNDIVR